MGTRPYLRPTERRNQILDAASRLFDRGGFTAIGVSAVADEAGVSRRLIYDHFADLGDLYEAFFEHRVAQAAAAIDAASTSAGPDGPRSVEGAVRELLAVPAEDLRVLHLVLADRSTPELDRARDRLQAHLEARWLPSLGQLGVEVDTARALLWTLAASFVTLAEQVHGGRLAAPAAERLGAAMVATLPELVGRLAPQPASEAVAR